MNVIYYRMMNKHNREKIDIDEDQIKWKKKLRLEAKEKENVMNR